MQIIFKKQKDKRNTIACIREDGSQTWDKIQPGFAIHDLIHYIVETTLGYQNAFYGLLEQGYNIEDFALPREQRPPALIPKNLPFEAIYTEFLVGLFQMEVFSQRPYDNFNQVLESVFEEKRITPFEPLAPNIIETIRNQIQTLNQEWIAIAPGEQLTLSF